LGVSAMPSESPSPSPLFLLATLLNIDWLLKCPRVSSLSSFTSPDGLQSFSRRVWNPLLQQEFGEDFVSFLLQLALHGTQHTIHSCNYLLRSGFWVQSYLIVEPYWGLYLIKRQKSWG
jgi:hypothetical protein